MGDHDTSKYHCDLIPFIAHAASASLLAGRNYIGIVQSNEDSVAIKKGLAGLDAEENEDNVDKADNADNIQE